MMSRPMDAKWMQPLFWSGVMPSGTVASGLVWTADGGKIEITDNVVCECSASDGILCHE